MRNIAILLILFLTAMRVASQALPVHAPVIVILAIQEGEARHARSGWLVPQPLLAGTLIHADDLIYPEAAAILVLCPDGRVREFTRSELFPNDKINCPANPSNYRIGSMATRRAILTRGGRQDPTVPYLISPRSTVVRTTQTDIVWNPLLSVEYYTLTVRAGSRTVWQSDSLDPISIIQGDVARVALPLPLQEDVPYTVEICVLFEDLHEGCTTDPGWASDVNIAFYHRPTPDIDQIQEDIIANLGWDTPESLYARAVLLTQSVLEPTPGEFLGVYHEAIALLETLNEDFPDHPLARSPELYNLLGELYRNTSLPRSAAVAFMKALDLSVPGTESEANAARGAATTVPGDPIPLYIQSLDAHRQFMTPNAYCQELTNVCQSIGDLCSNLFATPEINSGC